MAGVVEALPTTPPCNSVKQQKKVLKDQRKKIYSDLLVQGTNDSSIVSKRSVEMLYSSVYDEEVPQFFQHFVKKPQRRSPAINRGYWIRMNAIKNCIDKVIANENCKTNVIINLGCGYDPLPFQILDKKLKFLKNATPDMDFLCIDVDYPELISLKVEMIKNSPELLEIIGEIDDKNKVEGVLLKTKNYAAVGCNLRDLKLFQRQLTKLGLHELNTCSIFIAEVSLAYMLPEHADAVIEESSTFPKSHFLILEQLLPTNEVRHPFGRTMLHHFNRLNTPLKCVTTYKTIQDQINRFNKCGFPQVEARDLLGCWDELISIKEKERVRSVEAFDELEEFINYTQHYIVVHATNSQRCCFQFRNKDLTKLNLKHDESFNLTYNQVSNPSMLERKFLSGGVTHSDDIIIVGGSSQIRLSSSVIISHSTPEELQIKEYHLTPRMCHTLTSIGSRDEFVLIGGRNAPHKPLKDCWKLVLDKGIYTWERIADLPEPRSRHSAVKVNHNKILCFGGLSCGSTGSPFLLYDLSNNTWENVQINGDYETIGNMKSAALSFDEKTQCGYIVGGLTNDNVINDTLYKFQFSGNNEICISQILQNELLQRYGSKMIFVSENKLLLVGGVSNNFALDQWTTILSIELSTLNISSVKLSDDIWNDGSMFVGFEMLKLSNGSIVCIGGGAVCFGFGSFWNDKILVINSGDDDDDDLGEKDWNILLETIVT